jgi:hypothetical protein
VTQHNALASLRGHHLRVQEVHTPTWILDAASEALGGEIHIDPCAASEPEHWFASRVNLRLSDEALAIERRMFYAQLHNLDAASDLKAALKPHYLTTGGVVEPWGPVDWSAFGNVPFGFLEAWLARFQREGLAGRKCVGLWPMRTYRSWWCEAHAGADIVCLSYDVKFVGHTNTFPAPLCLAAWNCVIPDLGERETLRVRLRSV